MHSQPAAYFSYRFNLTSNSSHASKIQVYILNHTRKSWLPIDGADLNAPNLKRDVIRMPGILNAFFARKNDCNQLLGR